MSHGETLDQEWPERAARPALEPIPGVVVIASSGQPLFEAIRAERQPLILGRGKVGSIVLEDACLSRRHAQVARDGDTWIVTDLGSRNGSALDGDVFAGERRAVGDRVLRVGDTVLLLLDDARPHLLAGVGESEGFVVGPRLREAWARIDAAARDGDTLHVTGESGAGKELAARRFHTAGPRASGPFIAVNCATIPRTLAERLLFGAKKGAFSGADADADGYLQSADRGTLFLDEIAELDLAVQAKLLRVLETREVMALGASRARKVELGIVSATHGMLRHRVDEGRFRHDLYFRLGRPDVTVPPLRERREEIPWLAHRALAGAGDARAHASLVEAAVLRSWPGNVRELFVEMREAARSAAARGGEHVEACDLSADAGRATAPSPAKQDDAPVRAARAMPRRASTPLSGNSTSPPREVLVEALRASRGNITHAARALSVHRTQLRRWLARHGLEATRAGDAGTDPRS